MHTLNLLKFSFLFVDFPELSKTNGTDSFHFCAAINIIIYESLMTNNL